ncbi:MAG: hypothetical protein ACI4EW_04670 [Butyrivibrio sp.]
MIKFSKKLYFGKMASLDEKRLKKIVKHEKFIPGVFVVTLAKEPGNLLDICEMTMLNTFSTVDKSYTVVGIALGKGEALELVERIVEEVYDKTHDMDMQAYFC